MTLIYKTILFLKTKNPKLVQCQFQWRIHPLSHPVENSQKNGQRNVYCDSPLRDLSGLFMLDFTNKQKVEGQKRKMSYKVQCIKLNVPQ